MVKRISKSQDDNDDDLKDLLSNDKMNKSSNSRNSSNGTETEHLNLDHLVQGKQDLTTSPSSDSNKSSSPRNSSKRGSINTARAYNSSNKSSSLASNLFPPLQFIWHILRTIFNYVAMLCHFYPGLCSVVLFATVGLCLYSMARAVFNPRRQYGVLKHDHSDIKSVYDLQVGKIDHWCLRGDNDSCQCEDPLAPTSRGAEHKSWQLAFKTNRKMVKALEESQTAVDIAFIGESIVEEMDGRWLGRQRKSDLGVMEQTFQANFNKAKGGSVNGVALGIAGDTSPNVLWRLIHGEMSDRFNPKVWWVTLGMNDIGRMQCSEEVVVLGILRVVEEIINAKPDAHVVINSLFPMTFLRGEMYPFLHDYKDSLGATAKSDQQAERAEQRADRGDRGGWIRDGKRKTTDPRYATPLAPPVDAARTEGANRQPQKKQRQPAQRDGDAYRLGFQNRRRDLRLRNKNKRNHEEHEKILPAQARAENHQTITVEQEGEDADAEEEVRERQAARPKHHVFQPRQRAHDQINTPTYYEKKNKRRPLVASKTEPLLIEQHQIRKRTTETQLPLWTSVVVVNDQLRKFAQRNANRVTFFDATPLFTSSTSTTSRNGKPQYHLRTDLITQRGHPTPMGFRIWEGAVLQKLQPILEQYNRDHPTAAAPAVSAPTAPVTPVVDADKDNSNQFNPGFLTDDEEEDGESSADNLDGVHLDFDAIRGMKDDDFENDAFQMNGMDDNFDDSGDGGDAGDDENGHVHGDNNGNGFQGPAGQQQQQDYDGDDN